MVFARYIAFILSTYLGKFIKGLNKNSVNFSLLRGSFELKNVELASDLLSFSDHLQLERGTIGSLSVSIPWHSLYSRKCEVQIRDVDIIVAPKYGQKQTSSAFFKSQEEFLATVQGILADECKEEKSEKESKHGFLHRLSQTILKNLVFRLENVSFQLEDKSGCWQGCSAGIKVQVRKLSCEATDSKFSPVFIRPEEQNTADGSIYRLVSYENAEIELLYASAADVIEEQSHARQNGQSSSLSSGFAQGINALRSSQGVFTVAWGDAQLPERTSLSLHVSLIVRDSSMSFSPYCVSALGVLSESVRCAPQRAYAWEKRPKCRPCQGNAGSCAEWWRYSIQKIEDNRRASHERSRFSWEAFSRRKLFLSNFLIYCMVLLKASWVSGDSEAPVDEAQLSQTPAHEIMTCWNAARYYVKQYERSKQVPIGSLYSQYLRYSCLHASDSPETESLPNKIALALMNAHLTIECEHLTSSLDDNLRSILSSIFLSASKKGDSLSAQISVSTATVVAGDADDNPLLSIDGDGAGAMLCLSKSSSSPLRGQLSIESISTCLDFSFQELLISKIASYVAAAKPFLHQRFTKPKRGAAAHYDSPHARDAAEEHLFAEFAVDVKSVVANADGVSLCIRKVESLFLPQSPIAIKLQEVTATVNDVSLVQLCSIEVSPALGTETNSVGVVVDSAALSTNVEGFEYVKLLIGATARRWKMEAGKMLVETSSFFKLSNEIEAVKKETKSAPMQISIRFGFIEYGALALDAFRIQATLGDGWHIRLGAAGGTTEGWCHSVPPHPGDVFIEIDMWADGFLVESPFDGNIESNGIAFLFRLNHVTLCLGDELAASAEALFDLMMLVIFDDEDRHVHLRDGSLYTIPHISGRLIGSDVNLLLESDGGDLTLLPGYAAAMKDEATREAFAIPMPPMPLTIELPGEDCLDVTLHRYGDKRMDIAVALQQGVNAFLRGTPAQIPLLPLREGTRAEIELHLSAPGEADLRVFPYSRVDISMKLAKVAVVAHIPTIMALWNNFNTPSLPLARVRNIGNRVHFVSRPSRPGRALPPRSPTSAAVEAIGAAAFARSSPFSSAAAAQYEGAPGAAPLKPSAVYTTPVFPSDVTLHVEIERAELYYPWGEGSVAPLFLRATVPTCSVSVLNRDECVTVSVRGEIKMPHVATSPSTFPVLPEEGEELAKRGTEDRATEATASSAGCQRTKKDYQCAVEESAHADVARTGVDSPQRETTHIEPANAQSPKSTANAFAEFTRTSAALPAFPGGEKAGDGFGSVAKRQYMEHSSSIQVHLTYTMDSRPPYRPGKSNESLVVSLSGTAVPGSGALPGPLHICLQNPVEVGAWLTFFTFFNVNNTVPLSSSDAAVFSTLTVVENGKSNGEGGTQADLRGSASEDVASLTATTAGDAPRGMRTVVRLTSIVFHLPFAGAAAVLWDGVEFVASPGYNALRIPQLEVMVHEDLLPLDGPARLGAVGSSLNQLRKLRDNGFSVLLLRGSKDNASHGGASAPGVLLETQQNGASAAGVKRRLLIPALQGQANQQTTLVQLQSCATLTALSAVLEARSAQSALLNAVIERESQRLGLRYACCLASTSAIDNSDAQVQAQLRPFLSAPMVMFFQNLCFTYEWESGLKRDVRAGLTLALHDLRCNDYEAYNRAKSEDTSDTAANSMKSSPASPNSKGSRYPLSPTMPFLLHITSADAYVWWISTDADVAAPMHRASTQASNSAFPFRLARGVEGGVEGAEERDKAVKGDRRPAPPAPVGTCLPLLLYPIGVHTALSSGTPDVVAAGKKVRGAHESDGAVRHAALGSEKCRLEGDSRRRSASSSQGSQSNQTPHAASTASFHTMPSSSEDAPAAAPKSPLLTTDVAVTPVLEVSPVHVVLSTAAYVILSDALLHKRPSGSADAGHAAHAGHSAHIASAHLYSLARYEVHRLRPERASSLSTSVSSSTASVPRCGSTASGSSLSDSSGNPRRRGSSDEETPKVAAAAHGASLCHYLFDSAEQRVWVEKAVIQKPALKTGAATPRAQSFSLMSAAPSASEGAPANEQEDVAFIPLSSVRTLDGLLSSAVSGQFTQPVPNPSETALGDGAVTGAAPPHTSSAPAATSVHVTVVAPFNPSSGVIPRLQSRVAVAEVCIRLVLFEGHDSSLTMVGKAGEFWQRYTAVHTAARQSEIAAANALAASAAAATACDPSAPSVLAFLAGTVPALRTLLRVASYGPAWSRGSSAANGNRQRTGPPSPAALLDENGEDALCIQLRGVGVSSFADARSIVMDSCVCTSVKSPARPLLAVEQVEVYVPTSSVAYPSVAAAAKTVARDLDSAAPRTRQSPEVYAATDAAAATTASKTTVAFSSEGSNVASRQDTGTSAAEAAYRRASVASTARAAAGGNTRSPVRRGSGRPCSSSLAASKATGGSAGGRSVVMLGEVGCRVDAITVDISATALRAWLSCLVEQPVAALRAAAEEKEKWVAFWGTRSSVDAGGEDAAQVDGVATASEGTKCEEAAAPGSPVAEPASLLKWRPGRGLRIHEARDAVWSLEHDITLSRNGLVLFFSNHNTNLMTVLLNGHSVILDEALLLQPEGLQRTVMVIQGGLTVRFVGSGRVQVPLGLWNPSLWDSKGNTGVEAVLLPFMAIGEGSYLECTNVRLGFNEPANASVKEGEGAAKAASPTASSTPFLPQPATPAGQPEARFSGPSSTPSRKAKAGDLGEASVRLAQTAKATSDVPAASAPLTHRSVHLVLPRVSLILEPRQESRQVHISTAAELWMSMCGGVLLRDDLRCTGLSVTSESIYDATTTTASTAVLAPVDVSVCSNNGRHHAVSLGPAQIDLGRADLLLLSTYAGEVQAVRSYAKYLTHSRVEKEFLELVEETLAWKATAPVDLYAAQRDGEDEVDEGGSAKGGEDEEDSIEGEKHDEEGSEDDGEGMRMRHNLSHQSPVQGVKPCRDLVGESLRIDVKEHLSRSGQVDVAVHPRPPALSRQESGQHAALDPLAAIQDSVSSRRSGRSEGNVAALAGKLGGDANEPIETSGGAAQDKEQNEVQQAEKRSGRLRQRRNRQSQTRGFSWAVFTPTIELTVSDHRYPLLQLCVQDIMLRRTSTSAMTSTSRVRCQKASMQVYGRGRWDAFLLPSAALTWSLTQSVSRHSSNRHVLFNVEGIHVQCSHLIVAKLLYISRQLKLLTVSLQKRLAAAAMVATGERTTTAVDLTVPFSVDPEGVALLERSDSHALSATTSKRSSSSSISNSGGSESSSGDSSSDTSTGDSAEENARISRRCVHPPAVGAASAVRDPSSPSVAVEPAFTESAASSRYARADGLAGGAPGGAPGTASMATHRLLNSFRRTLFAGICEREAVAPLFSPAIGGRGDGPSPLVHARAAKGEEAVPMVWRCKEIYRLAPASATDIFISYRRARSLVLTFFPVGCVEWDEDIGTWVLNARGETDLAAKAVKATRSTTTPAAVSKRVPVKRDAEDDEHGVALPEQAALNWFPFTSLQYGMARPVAVRTAARVEVARPAATATSTPLSSNTASGRGTSDARRCSLDVADGSDFSHYKIQTFALALTCVDPEEEAESLRYPIVVAPGEVGSSGSSHGSGQFGPERRDSRQARAPAAAMTSRPASPPLSRGPSSVHVDSATGGDAALADERSRAFSGSSGNFTQTAHQHSHPRPRSPIGSPTSSVPLPHSTHRRYHAGHGGTQHRHQQQPSSWLPRQSSHATTTNTADGGDGDGDLLVVRVQARSSLLNETGCTLQLRSPSLAADAPTPTMSAAAPVAVPPGWRLPLEDEHEHDEVILRVCCPSARWVSTTQEARTGEDDGESSRDSEQDEMDGCAGSNRIIGGAATTRWYETRLVLGDLDSGRFLSLNLVAPRSALPSDAAVSPTVPTAAIAADTGTFEDQDQRQLALFVVITYSSDNLIKHISLYPRLTLVNHLGVKVRVAVFQQDPAAGPQTPDEAMLLAPWTAPYVDRGRHERERFHRSLVTLGAHDALPHQHALPLHFCTYRSNLVLGLSFSQSTGDTLITSDLVPVVTHLRDAVDGHPRMLCLHDTHGRTFYVQVSVMPRTVVLSVALWVYNLTEYPLLMSDSVFTRRLCPGQNSTTGIIPSQGEPFLIGCRLTDFTQGFFAIGLDGGWSGAVPIDVGSTGVFVSALSRLGIQRSCNYSILFPNAQEGRPMVLQITPRWVFYNNTQKRLRIYFRFPGLAKAMEEAKKKRRQLQMQEAESQLAAPTNGTGAQSPKHNQVLRQADDNVSTLTSLATVQLNAGEYHVSCVGPIEGNQFCVQDVLEGVLPSVTSIRSIAKDGKAERRDVAAYYESHLTPYMDVDRPGEATFNLWAAPRAPGKQMAVCLGGELVVQRPVFPHPTWLEPYDVYATDAVITGRIAVEVQNSQNVLTVLLQPIQGTKILLQNRTARNTVMARQQGSRRRNRIPACQNRFFLWEDARQEHRIRVHILGFKGRWFDVDFSAGECQVTYHEDMKAAAQAEAVAEAQQAHPWPTEVKSDDVPHTPFSFFVRGYANLEKTRVTIVVTESAIPLYASIDSWRTSAVLSLQVSMVQLSWIAEVSAGVAAAMNATAPLGAAAAGVGGEAVAGLSAAARSGGGQEGEVIVVGAGDAHRNMATEGSPLRSPLVVGGRGSGSAARRRERSVFGFSSSTASLGLAHSGNASLYGSSGAFTSTPLLLSIILEGVQLERLSTEDTETFFFAIHQMQWIDEKLNTVFVYRARPRLPPVLPASGTPASPGSSATFAISPRGVSGPRRTTARRSAPSSPAPTSTRERAARLIPKAAGVAIAATNRVLDTVFGQSDAFLLAMEKQNDVEFSYNFLKYADGVTRFTELRYVLTPLVMILTDFMLVDAIQEVHRLRVLLGLRKQSSMTQTTTTVPMMMLPAPALQQQRQQLDEASSSAQTSSAFTNAGNTEGSVIPVEIAGEAGAKAVSQAISRVSTALRRRGASDVVIEVDDVDDDESNHTAAVQPTRLANTSISENASADASAHQRTAAQSTKSHPLQEPPWELQNSNGSASSSSSSSRAGSDTEATTSSYSSTPARTRTVIRPSRRVTKTAKKESRSHHSEVERRGTASRQSTATPPSSTVPSSSHKGTPRAPAIASSAQKSATHHSRTTRSASQPSQQQQQQQQQQGFTSAVAVNTTGFVSQGVFLLQLVQGVRVQLQRQGTGLMAGSLAAVATSEGRRRKAGGLLHPLRGVGGLVGAGAGVGGHRRQFVSTTVRHHRGVVQRGGAGDGLAGAITTTANATGGAAADGDGHNAAGAGGVDPAVGAGTVSTAAATSNVNTASFMFIERLEVHRITLYVTFKRHRPDPLRPLLGAYAWMLPSQLSQREFYLPAWTLRQQVETAASLRARMVRWGMHSLREQWTKVTKLGTLLDALQFWQYRTLPLHGPPQTLTLTRVQLRRQERGGRPISFAPCVSSAEEEEEEDGEEPGEEASSQSRVEVAPMAPLSPQRSQY